MKRFQLQVLRAVLATATLAIAMPATADPSVVAVRPAASPLTTDVVLDAQGVLHGQLVDADGDPLPGASVRLTHNGQWRRNTTTLADGSFRFVGLQGGLYHVDCRTGGRAMRLWVAGTAPPCARQILQLADRPATIRGQSPPFRTRPQFYRAAAVAGLVGIGWGVYEAIDKETPPGS